MRLDKFLKVARIVKRREIAKKLCDAGVVTLNKKIAKPSSEIVVGDELFIIMGRHHLLMVIKDIREFASKEDARNMFEIISDTIVEEEEC